MKTTFTINLNAITLSLILMIIFLPWAALGFESIYSGAIQWFLAAFLGLGAVALSLIHI